MARKAQFPPPIYTKNGYAFCRVAGKHRHLGTVGSDKAKAAYAALVAELSGARPSPAPIHPSALTVADVVLAFLEYADRHYSARGREASAFRQTVPPLLALHGATAAAKFGPKALREVQAAMCQNPYSWSRGVVNRRVVRIKTMWRWAESEELLPAGSYHALATVRGLASNAPGVRNTAGHLPTSWDDLERVRARCPRTVGVMLAVQWLAGMRSCEIRLMQAHEIDRAGPTVDGVQVWLYRPSTHKNEHRGQTRVIPLGPTAQRLLLEHGLPEAGYVFPARRGRSKRGSNPYRDDSYARAVARACEAAGVKITPYGSRHAAANRIKHAAGLDGARAFLGHASVAMSNRYGDQIDTLKASELAAKMG